MMMLEDDELFAKQQALHRQLAKAFDANLQNCKTTQEQFAATAKELADIRWAYAGTAVLLSDAYRARGIVGEGASVHSHNGELSYKAHPVNQA